MIMVLVMGALTSVIVKRAPMPGKKLLKFAFVTSRLTPGNNAVVLTNACGLMPKVAASNIKWVSGELPVFLIRRQ